MQSSLQAHITIAIRCTRTDAERVQIIGVHNHMTDEQSRLFFVHFWKVGAPADLASGLKAALAVTKVR